jgi:hypothetical protein
LPGIIFKNTMAKSKTSNWNAEIEEIETFFAIHKDLPDSIRLSKAENIINVPLFLKSHLNSVKAQNGNPTFRATLERLLKLKTILST